jgi:hypothetical protein
MRSIICSRGRLLLTLPLTRAPLYLRSRGERASMTDTAHQNDA